MRIDPSQLQDSDFEVDSPEVGVKYHISWARHKGMVWILKELKGKSALLETPKTRKPIRCNVHDLREINKNALKNAQLRKKLGDLY